MAARRPQVQFRHRAASQLRDRPPLRRSCAGAAQTPYRDLGAYGTSSADYVQLRKIFSTENGIRISPDDVLVDVGCGKGRVLNHWLEMGLDNRLVGVELDRDVAAFAARRLGRFPNVEVVCGDAIEELPRDGTVFFLFNPFNRGTLSRFAERIATQSETPSGSSSSTTSRCTPTCSPTTPDSWWSPSVADVPSRRHRADRAMSDVEGRIGRASPQKRALLEKGLISRRRAAGGEEIGRGPAPAPAPSPSPAAPLVPRSVGTG